MSKPSQAQTENVQQNRYQNRCQDHQARRQADRRRGAGEARGCSFDGRGQEGRPGQLRSLNPNTDKMVKRDTPMGKKLAEAEKTGTEVAKTMTETQRLMLIVKAMADAAGFDDADIKAALGTDEIQAELPRAFPAAWGGKHKEARHPDHPKQPSNSFIFFCKAVRPSTKDANPKATPKELISIMSKMWKDTVDDGTRSCSAAADKERYESEMAVFEAEHPEEARSSKSSPGKPTKATAYGMLSTPIVKW